jgi:hypothetical protein
VPAPALAQLRKSAIAVGSGTPLSARRCRIAEITGLNPLTSTRKSAQATLGSRHPQWHRQVNELGVGKRLKAGHADFP